MYYEKLMKIIEENKFVLEDLQLVKSLEIPNTYIAAGYIRNLVWDGLHDYQKRTPLDDVDVIYFDPQNRNEDREKELEQMLISKSDQYKWSVKNQARMHVLKNDKPYASIEDAMKRWPETATAVGIRLNEQNEIEIIAPHGLDDLFELKIRKSDFFLDKNYFWERIGKKEWLRKWPFLKIVE